MQQRAGPLDSTGRDKTFLLSTSLPVMGEIAGVNMASLGIYLHSSKTRARWAEGFHDEPTAACSTWRGIGSVRLYLACDSSHDRNKQPCHTVSVAARVSKDRTFSCTPGRMCQACYWCIIEDSWKRQHHHWHMKHKDTKSCRKTPRTN